MNTWKAWRFMLGVRRTPIVLLVVACVVGGLTESAILTAVAQVAAALVDRLHTIHAEVGPVHLAIGVSTLLAATVGIALLRLALQVPISLLPAQIAADVQARLRRDLYDAFTAASWSAQSRDLEGHLQELMTNQIGFVSRGTLSASAAVTSVFTLLVLVLTALALNALAAVVVLVAAVLLFGLLRPLDNLGGQKARALSQSEMVLAGGVSEGTRLIQETRVFGVSEAQRQHVHTLIDVARELFMRTQLLARLLPNIYQSLIYLVVVGGLAALYAANPAHVASLGAVVLLLVRAGAYGQQFQGNYQYVRQSLPYLERLNAAEAQYVASTPTEGRQPLPAVHSIECEAVSFGYSADRPVLSDVSFEVSAGEAIGIVGPSGAGKSTLVQILLQLRYPQDGRYLVNGIPADLFSREDWTQRVAYVPQEPRLIHASVAANIRYFRDLSDAAVKRAAELANIAEEIAAWPDGYDTLVGPRADAVSGGQQQRLCIARALAAEPDILVLDEPTSALDPASERLIQDSLLEIKRVTTLFIVAHRMATLEVCDRVIVMMNGRIEAFESAAELRRANEYYRYVASLTSGAAPSAV